MRTAYALCRDYPAPVAAILALTVLFGIALFRLAQVHQDLRENVGTNMYWVVSQSQIESLMLSRALRGKLLEPASEADVHLQYQLLLSRLNVLRDGPQERYLEEKGIAAGLTTQFADIEALAPLFQPGAPVTRDTLARAEPTLRRFAATMAEAAADAMAHQWYDSGERLDKYRNTVLTTIMLMVGILLCCTVIAAKLMVSLIRIKESEQSRMLAAQLERQLDAERKVSELYRDFSAMVSHQFRTPLAIIDSSMQRMIRASDRLSSNEIARRANKVREAIQRLTALMDSTLSAEKLVNSTKVSLQTHDLRQIAEEATHFQLSDTPNREIRLTHDPHQPAIAYCDPVLTGQILLNLISNATKYSPAHEPIEVRIGSTAESVWCSVTDFGSGIGNEELPLIFDRYYRASSSATIVGTGIGLHVARQLAQLQQGELSAKSTPGRGSTFVLKLPRAVPETAVPTSSSESYAL